MIEVGCPGRRVRLGKARWAEHGEGLFSGGGLASGLGGVAQQSPQAADEAAAGRRVMRQGNAHDPGGGMRPELPSLRACLRALPAPACHKPPANQRCTQPNGAAAGVSQPARCTNLCKLGGEVGGCVGRGGLEDVGGSVHIPGGWGAGGSTRVRPHNAAGQHVGGAAGAVHLGAGQPLSAGERPCSGSPSRGEPWGGPPRAQHAPPPPPPPQACRASPLAHLRQRPQHLQHAVHVTAVPQVLQAHQAAGGKRAGWGEMG